MMLSPALEGTKTAAISWLRLLRCSAALLATLALATSASAGTFSLNASIAIDGSNNNGSGVFGTINVVSGHGTLPAPTGNAVGSVTDKTLQDFVWFSITLDAGSAAIDRFQASVGPISIFNPEYFDFGGLNNNPKGASYSAANGGVAPNGNGFANALAIDSGFGAFSQYNWDFGAVSGANLQAGQTSADLLWAGERLLSGGPGVILENPVNFLISTAGTANSFNVQGVVPEPSSALLLASGLCGISLVSRRGAGAA